MFIEYGVGSCILLCYGLVIVTFGYMWIYLVWNKLQYGKWFGCRNKESYTSLGFQCWLSRKIEGTVGIWFTHWFNEATITLCQLTNQRKNMEKPSATGCLGPWSYVGIQNHAGDNHNDTPKYVAGPWHVQFWYGILKWCHRFLFLWYLWYTGWWYTYPSEKY